ncbi:hypothetical protein BCR32DRAFT_283061 [Anaeromyces robustus]|uniref:Uncharacterized protein n=1 Tax=Anaeromyces robustus TaxID=1754192 RepID=A0A1Y1WW29_9FUNG|nr:hypothetical protein BCR32DRAFT_283061 [Anaeromyces robustus]|eukprot:ORX77605.1 hypothetical protein BCR32DRAFT_283061 [Anaeromyces robustus]
MEYDNRYDYTENEIEIFREIFKKYTIGGGIIYFSETYNSIINIIPKGITKCVSVNNCARCNIICNVLISTPKMQLKILNYIWKYSWINEIMKYDTLLSTNEEYREHHKIEESYILELIDSENKEYHLIDNIYYKNNEGETKRNNKKKVNNELILILRSLKGGYKENKNISTRQIKDQATLLFSTQQAFE